MSAKEVEFHVFINDHIVKFLDKFPRGDIAEYSLACYAVGWGIQCDIQEHLTKCHGGVVLEVRVGLDVIARSYHHVRINGHYVPPLCYVHIPKTGGTSVRNSIKRLADTKMLEVYGQHQMVKPEALTTYSKGLFDSFDLIFGHFRPTHIPEHSRHLLITIFRRPQSLLLSYYLFTKYVLKTKQALSFFNIFDAIEAKSDPFYDNVLTRIIADVPDLKEVEDDDFRKACERIESEFLYIGIFEDMRTSCQFISGILGRRIVPIMENVTPRTIEGDMLDIARLRQSVMQHSAYDLKLYDFAIQKFWN